MPLEDLSHSKAAPPPKPPAPPASGEKRDFLRPENCRRKRSRRPTAANGSVSDPESSDDLFAHILVMLAHGGKPQDEEAATATASAATTSTSTAADKSRHLYECDVCFKTFRSHQALGGHKASHRKSATVAAAEAEYVKSIAAKSFPATPLNPSGKPHVCKRCNMSFASGQALGGHQRRHYVSPEEDLPSGSAPKIPATATATATASGVTSSDGGGASTRAPRMFDFDLNQLPDLDLQLGLTGDLTPSPAKGQTTDDHEVESPMTFKKPRLLLGSLLSL